MGLAEVVRGPSRCEPPNIRAQCLLGRWSNGVFEHLLCAISYDWHQRQHDRASMIGLTVQPFLDHRGCSPRYLLPGNSNCRYAESFRDGCVVESNNHRRRDLKLSITDERRLGQAIAATKNGVGLNGTKRCRDVLDSRTKEPASCRNYVSGRKDLAEAVDSALASPV